MRKIIFSKFPDGRAARFSLQTNIVKDGDILYVEKVPMEPAAAFHIENLTKSYALLSEAVKRSSMPVTVNACQRTERGLRFPFVEGETLEEVLLSYARKNRPEEILSLLRQYYRFLCETMAGEEPDAFSPTEEYAAVFLDPETNPPEVPVKGPFSSAYINIDLILSNILVNESGWNIIDYEWDFCFPVPVRFVFFRTVFYLYIRHAHEIPLPKAVILDVAKISHDEECLFQTMEESFQRYVKGDALFLAEYRNRIGKDWVDFQMLLRYYDRLREHKRFQVLFDHGQGFSEEDSFSVECQNTEHAEAIEILLEKDCKRLRIDPLEDPCVIRILSVETNHAEALSFRHNGACPEEHLYVFPHEDPQLVIENELPAGTRIRIEFIYGMLQTNAAEQFLGLFGEKQEERETEKKWLLTQKDEVEKQLREVVRMKTALQEEKDALLQELNNRRTELQKLKEELAGAMYAYDEALADAAPPPYGTGA